MSIRVTCEKCGVVLKVKEELAGTKGKCPACKGTLNVPTLEQAAAQAAARLGATETAQAAAVGDTGAIKIPTKAKVATKVASAADDGGPPPPTESNGSAVKHSPVAEAAPAAETAPPAAPAENPRDDLSSPAAPAAAEKTEAAPRKDAGAKPKLRLPDPDPDEPAAPAEKPKPAGKQKLQMSDTDAEASDTAEPPRPKESKAPAAEEKPAASKASSPPPSEAKSGEGDFDLDSFLMEGPKPKALPPIQEDKGGKKGATPPRAGGGRRLSMSDDETNVSGPSETLPPPNKGRASAAESAMAALTGGNATSSSAKDLLNRASQEGRARASQMPEDQKERFDYAGALKQIGREYGLHVGGTIVLCVVLYTGMNYMMGSNIELPPLARVSGKVTLKGQAVPGVVVNFTPVGSKDAKDGGPKVKKGAPRSASALTDKEGNFELTYMEGIRGAVVGQNKVWIAPQTPEDFKKIPGAYQSANTSGDIREVKATGGEENIELSK